MKTITRFVALCYLLIPFAIEGQEPLPPAPQSVPGAKIVAVGKFNARPTPLQLQTLSLRWYLTGKIDQWFSPKDGNGVVLVLNLSSEEEAHALLDVSLPGQPQLLSFELIPVIPLIPLSKLLPQPVKHANLEEK